MTEQDIQADYRRKVGESERTFKEALTERIKALKVERNEALALLREEVEANAEREVETEAKAKPRKPRGPRHEAGPEATQGRPVDESRPEAGLDSGQGSQQEAESAEAPQD